MASGGGAKHFFDAVRGGANLFFCPPDVVFISDDHVINATSLTKPVSLFFINSIIHHIIYTETRTRYKKLVEHKVCPPIGLLNWCLDFEVEAHVIKTACNFVK